MAVYTEVGFEQADAFVRGLGRGRVRALQGISAGIENTNYFVSSDTGEWVLTLFERLGVEQLPFYLRYMQHLAQHGIRVNAIGPVAATSERLRSRSRSRADACRALLSAIHDGEQSAPIRAAASRE